MKLCTENIELLLHTMKKYYVIELSQRILFNLYLIATMGWQTTFTLAKKAKGCHLVTDEVVEKIRPGLEGVKASFPLGYVTL